MASTTEPPPMATNSNDPMKLAIAIALTRSKLFSQHASSSSSSSSRLLHWKQKAKIRKQEIVRLTEDLKHLEDDLRRDLYPETASCKCYFFNNLQTNNFTSDHRLNDVLHRRFLRLVRLHKRIKRKESNSMDHRVFSEFNGEEGIEQLKISVEFLVDLCETPKPEKKPNFTNLAHQAADFILGSLGRLLSMETGADKLEGTISSLIVCLVKRMCTPFEEELCDPDNDSQIHIQHVCRTLGSASYIGQRFMLSVCHRIAELAGQLLLLDPFDESFALIHDSMFMMIQLIEFLVSDNLVTWSKEEGFEIRLFEEWLDSFHNARKTLQSLEKRSVLYALYMDRVAVLFPSLNMQVSNQRSLKVIPAIAIPLEQKKQLYEDLIHELLKFSASMEFGKKVSIQRLEAENEREVEQLTKEFHNTEEIDDLDQVDFAIVRALVANGISYSVLQNPDFLKMVIAINNAPKGYKPPSIDQARTSFSRFQREGPTPALVKAKVPWSVRRGILEIDRVLKTVNG